MSDQQASTVTCTLRQLQVNGIGLNVMFAGEHNSGPTVLLVHGFPDDHTVWRNQVAPLVAAGYRVIAPDTRGCGDSQMSPREKDYRVDNLVPSRVYHLDLYRLGDPGELEYLGLRDLVGEASVLLVEWPERGLGALPPPDLRVAIDYLPEGRRLVLEAPGGAGARLIEDLAEARLD